MPDQIEYMFFIKAPKQKVWEALTNPDQTEKYWFTFRLISDWKLGSKLWFEYKGEKTDEHTITAIKPGSEISYQFHSLQPEFVGEAPSQVDCKIRENQGITCLELRHYNFPPQSKIYIPVRWGWALILSNLKTYLESGSAIDGLDFEADFV